MAGHTPPVQASSYLVSPAPDRLSSLRALAAVAAAVAVDPAGPTAAGSARGDSPAVGQTLYDPNAPPSMPVAGAPTQSTKESVTDAKSLLTSVGSVQTRWPCFRPVSGFKSLAAALIAATPRPAPRPKMVHLCDKPLHDLPANSDELVAMPCVQFNLAVRSRGLPKEEVVELKRLRYQHVRISVTYVRTLR